MFEIILGGFILRFVQCLAQAAPFIFTGLIIAGIFQRLMGRKELQRLFGEGTSRSLFQAWLIGMLLPVCSLGVIPVIRIMRRSGIAGGTILAFAMSAPLFNPLSLLYGLTLSEPITILAFGLCSLVVVTIVGMIWDRIYQQTIMPLEPVQEVPFGIKRMLAIAVVCCREMAGPTLGYIVIGLAGVGLLGAFLPIGALQRQANHDNIYAPLIMSLVSIPVYATPMLAMSQLGMMFQHVNSVGAGFVLLILGAGMNMGLFAWMVWNYDIKKSLIWLVMLMVVVLGLAYGVDGPLAPKGIEPADHTHAFDIYCQPFHSDAKGIPKLVFEKLSRDILPYEWYSLGILVAILALGLLLQGIDPQLKLEAWLEKPPTQSTSGKLDIILPGYVLALFSLAGLIAISLVGCYAYYPTPKEAFEEMFIIRGEALSGANSADYTHTKYWLEQLDDWSRKVQVGVYLREWELSDYHNMRARILREKMELLEHEVEEFATLKSKYLLDQTPDNKQHYQEVESEVRKMVSNVDRNYRRMRDAYLEEL